MVKHHSLELYEMAYDYAVKACEIEPNDERLKQNLKLIYLGREYMFKCEWLKCIETLKRHLSLKSAVWNDERCASMKKGIAASIN